MTKSSLDIAYPQSCCILRLSALGDVTHVLPLLRALQQAWPRCQFTWIIGQREYELLSAIDQVEFIVFNKKGGWRAWQGLKRQLSRRRFDLLLHLQTSFRANLLSRLIKAQRRIGWDRSRSREGHHWFINESIREHPPQHQVQGYLAFARHFDIQADEPSWDMPITAENIHFARNIVDASLPTLIISPCSSHSRRDWSAENYHHIANYAVKELKMQVIICGGPSEREQQMGATIASADERIINFVGKDTLPQLTALLSCADIVLSPDSGPAHIANAVGTAVIGLYAATWSHRSGPYNSLQCCVDHFADAARKFRHCQAEDLRWGSRIEEEGVMDLISVQEVKQKLEQLLSALTRKP